MKSNKKESKGTEVLKENSNSINEQNKVELSSKSKETTQIDFDTIKDRLYCVSKDTLIEALGLERSNKCKGDLINDVVKYFKRSKRKMKAFIKTNDEDLALFPTKLEDMLNITKTERKKWTEDGRLEVVRYEDFRKYGKVMQTPYYSFYQAFYEISDETLNEWRIEDKAAATHARKIGAEIAKETRKKNDIIRKEAALSYDNMVSQWASFGEEAKVVGELAFWTMWVSRLAKEEQIKSKNTNNNWNSMKHDWSKEFYYKRKKDAITLLKQSQFSHLSVYEPEPGKRDRISVIRHTDNKYRGYYYDDYCDDELDSCQVFVEEDYYTLYYLSIVIGDTSFGFHLPYLIGLDFLPDKKNLDRVKHQENEGMFRFGRPMTSVEKIAYSNEKIDKMFRKTYQAAKALLAPAA